jgi:two-component system LytT family sensor kinase
LAWLIYILYEEVIVLFDRVDLSTVIAFIINAIVFYNAWKLPRYVIKKTGNLFLLIPALLISSTVLIAVTIFIKLEVDALENHTSFITSATIPKIQSLIMRTLYFAGLGAAYGFATELIKKEKETAQMARQQQLMEKKALQAELNLIKSQINPTLFLIRLDFCMPKLTKSNRKQGLRLLHFQISCDTL